MYVQYPRTPHIVPEFTILSTTPNTGDLLYGHLLFCNPQVKTFGRVSVLSQSHRHINLSCFCCHGFHHSAKFWYQIFRTRWVSLCSCVYATKLQKCQTNLHDNSESLQPQPHKIKDPFIAEADLHENTATNDRSSR
jgi:hypothetical protein